MTSGPKPLVSSVSEEGITIFCRGKIWKLCGNDFQSGFEKQSGHIHFAIAYDKQFVILLRLTLPQFTKIVALFNLHTSVASSRSVLVLNVAA